MARTKMTFLLLVCGAVSACGGDEQTSEKPGQEVTVAITAASGGMVAVGSAALMIPAGSLAADTMVTVKTATPSGLPESGTLKGLTYDFGPDGTTFSTPAALSLPVSGAPASGQAAVVSWLNTQTNQWEDLPTTASAGKVTAQVPHFTLFVVRFKGVATLDCSFGACGGDITGNWTLEGGCIDDPDASNPFGEVCPEATWDIDLEATGTITFSSAKTYTTSVTNAGKVHIVFPAKCASAFPGGGLSSCSQLAMTLDDKGGVVCTGTPTTACDCSGSIGDPKTETNSGTYTTSGNTLTMTDAADNSVDTMDYCVQGNQLKVQQIDAEDGTKAVFVAKK